MYIIALTGGIGSGKSTAARLFQQHGATVLDTDQIARQLTLASSPCFQAIVEHFGTSFVQADGELNRQLLGQHIFANPNAKQWLEELLHPKIKKLALEQAAASKDPYQIIVIPLLYQRQQYPAQRILLIDTPENRQIERIKQRDQLTAEQIKAIMQQQPSPATRENLADDIIKNDQGLDHLKTQVDHYHLTYCQYAQDHHQ